MVVVFLFTKTVQSTSTKGVETFVSGFGRLDEQDVVMRENESILLEKDYKDNYEGYDRKILKVLFYYL